MGALPLKQPATTFPAPTPAIAVSAGHGVADTQAALHAQIHHHLTARGYVPFHRTLAVRFGHRAALFLGACLYWTRRNLMHKPQQQGWFYMPVQQMTEATTLTRREQDTVRKELSACGILQERRGQGGILHYRINLRQLAISLDVLSIPPDEQYDLEKHWSLFGQPVSFYRPLADLTGSAAGGLYLSWLLRMQRQMLLQAKQGSTARMMHVDQNSAAETLGLTPKVLRTTRTALRKAGFIVERGVWALPNLPAIMACIQQQAIKPLPGKEQVEATEKEVKPPRESEPKAKVPTPPPSTYLITQQSLPLTRAVAEGAAPPAAKATDHGAWKMTRWVLVAGNQQLGSSPSAGANMGDTSQPIVSTAQNANLESAQNANPVYKWFDQSAQNANPDDQSANLELPKTPLHIKDNNKRNTTTTARASARAVDNFLPESSDCCRRFFEKDQDPDRSGLDGLIYPTALDPQLLPGIHDVLRQAPSHHRQALLDELQGQLRIPGKTIRNPAGWLAVLSKRVAQGAVLPLAESEADLRRQQEKVKGVIERSIAGIGSKPTLSKPETPVDPEQGKKAFQTWYQDKRKRRGL